MHVHRVAVWICCAFAFVVAPAAYAAPCAGFIDVQDTDPFCTHIAWMKNRAITLGCTANQYCPTLAVTRDQMAAFLYRLGFQNVFLQGGNAFDTTATLGTTDDRALHINVNGSRALRVAPASNGAFGSVPNLVGGHPGNNAAITCAGICIPTPEPVVGAVIAGGGPTLGGLPNRVTDSFGVVGGGVDNQAGNDDADHFNARAATVGGGVSNAATGAYSTVPGGFENGASGDYSFAAGRRAKANADGCFVWGDSTDEDIGCATPDSFRVRATGGTFILSSSSSGVRLSPGTSSWSMLSDRAMKANIVAVDAQAIVDQIAAMPIATWNYVSQSPEIRHIGPMAQDFHAAFRVGEDERYISTIDAQGVALAAIQGLNLKLEQKIAALETRNAALEAALTKLESRVQAFEALQQSEPILSINFGSRP